jgi:hypothetical protein
VKEDDCGANTVYFTYVLCKWKMRPVETIPGMVGGENEGEWWRG